MESSSADIVGLKRCVNYSINDTLYDDSFNARNTQRNDEKVYCGKEKERANTLVKIAYISER